MSVGYTYFTSFNTSGTKCQPLQDCEPRKSDKIQAANDIYGALNMFNFEEDSPTKIAKKMLRATLMTTAEVQSRNSMGKRSTIRRGK